MTSLSRVMNEAIGFIEQGSDAIDIILMDIVDAGNEWIDLTNT
ncbi:hypothetical protein O9992_19305 [Vibrio lentus]|nr:hypothetical protein [Vibrio lentus]